MSITIERKKELISEYSVNDKDTGSANVQIAILTERIRNLTKHLKDNHKDYSSYRGLLKLVGQRKRLLKYFKGKNLDEYLKLISALGIRK